MQDNIDCILSFVDVSLLFVPDLVVTDIDHHPGPAIAALMKLSFDEEHRHAVCTLGEELINRRHLVVNN